MITVEQYLKVVEFKITDGSEYQWQCYGNNARFLDCEHENYSVSIVFDSVNQTVYEADLWDYSRNRLYRLINPEYLVDLIAEEKARAPLYESDEIKTVDLETDDDWLEKANSIVHGLDYDPRVSIPVDLPDDELFALMKLAHERDVTLNQLIEEILTEVIVKNKSETPKIVANKKKNRQSKIKEQP